MSYSLSSGVIGGTRSLGYNSYTTNMQRPYKHGILHVAPCQISEDRAWHGFPKVNPKCGRSAEIQGTRYAAGFLRNTLSGPSHV